MSTPPLAPMLVQYLVGLCCLKWDPDAIDVNIGDMVLDTAAEKERDVDVTVTVAESSSTTHAFKAYEVKREGTPLDVAEVEALCLKLIDMLSITHRAIVSTSGFTTGGTSKSRASRGRALRNASMDAVLFKSSSHYSPFKARLKSVSR